MTLQRRFSVVVTVTDSFDNDIIFPMKPCSHLTSAFALFFDLCRQFLENANVNHLLLPWNPFLTFDVNANSVVKCEQGLSGSQVIKSSNVVLQRLISDLQSRFDFFADPLADTQTSTQRPTQNVFKRKIIIKKVRATGVSKNFQYICFSYFSPALIVAPTDCM